MVITTDERIDRRIAHLALARFRVSGFAGTSIADPAGALGISKAAIYCHYRSKDALGLARMGAHLAICGRDRDSTEAAGDELRAGGGGQADVFVADLSSPAQVRRLAGQVFQRLGRIDVLVNNVGGYWDTRHLTADGLERTFAPITPTAERAARSRVLS